MRIIDNPIRQVEEEEAEKKTKILMEEVSFNDKAKASIILIACLFLSSVWYSYYGTGATFTYPYVFNLETGERGAFIGKMHLFWTYYHPILCMLLIPIAQRICPRMDVGKYGDLWIYHYVYLAAMNLDFILTHRTGDFRIVTTIVFVVLQSAYLGYSALQESKR
jgi:hypothetical protein